MLAIAVKYHYNLINFLQNYHDIYPPRELWVYFVTRSCHQMETFSALRDICAGNSLVIGNFPAQRPVIRSFDVFFDLHLNKWLSKQSWGWWLEMPSHSLWCHSNEFTWCHKGPVIRCFDVSFLTAWVTDDQRHCYAHVMLLLWVSDFFYFHFCFALFIWIS